jgi:hypothetical protein
MKTGDESGNRITSEADGEMVDEIPHGNAAVASRATQ